MHAQRLIDVPGTDPACQQLKAEEHVLGSGTAQCQIELQVRLLEVQPPRDHYRAAHGYRKVIEYVPGVERDGIQSVQMRERPAAVYAYPVTEGAQEVRARQQHRHLRPPHRRLVHACQVITLPQVIEVEEGDVVAPRGVDTGVARRTNAGVLAEREHAPACVQYSMGSNHLRERRDRIVRAAIIDEQQLEISERLPGDARNALLEQRAFAGSAITRHYDGEAR